MKSTTFASIIAAVLPLVSYAARTTRKLHSSTDCLKASGFVVALASDWDQWRIFSATNAEVILSGRERFFRQDDPGKRWTDLSSWYWSAEKKPQSGPWWAVTVTVIEVNR